MKRRFSTTPETIGELRRLIESKYETVHKIKRWPHNKPIMVGFGDKPSSTRKPIYKVRIISGDGVSEKKAVADALNNISWRIGGKAIIWMNNIELFDANDFAANRRWIAVRGRAMVR